jgi:hypothetical protein
MRPLTAREVLEVWEIGATQSLAHRALLLLAAANPDRPYEALTRLSLGQRDVLLMTLREWLFGPQLISVASCPNCGERLQLTLSSHDLYAAEREESDSIALAVEGYSIRYRLPDSTDLLALSQDETVGDARSSLLRRCVQSIDCAGQAQPIEMVPAPVIDAIVAHMAQADSQADVQLDLNCPACQHHWLAAFDAVSFFWKEIDDWARRTVRDIHTIASTYGWSEAAILALSPARRQLYLDLIEA